MLCSFLLSEQKKCVAAAVIIRETLRRPKKEKQTVNLWTEPEAVQCRILPSFPTCPISETVRTRVNAGVSKEQASSERCSKIHVVELVFKELRRRLFE